METKYSSWKVKFILLLKSQSANHKNLKSLKIGHVLRCSFVGLLQNRKNKSFTIRTVNLWLINTHALPVHNYLLFVWKIIKRGQNNDFYLIITKKIGAHVFMILKITVKFHHNAYKTVRGDYTSSSNFFCPICRGYN